MKKIIVLLVVLMAVPAMAVPTFQTSDLTGFGKIDAYSSSSSTPPSLDLITTTVYETSEFTLTGKVGYKGFVDGTEATIDYVGIGLTSFDLTGVTSYEVTINNDNDDIWLYKLFVETAKGGALISKDWVSINGNYAGNPKSSTLVLDIANLTDLANVTAIGIQIGANRPDAYHTSIGVPAPGAMVLGSIGASFVGWLRRRRSL